MSYPASSVEVARFEPKSCFLWIRGLSPWYGLQTSYKLSYVDWRADSNPEQRICEDIPHLCDGMGDLDFIVKCVSSVLQ
jgi:hypothetical protein